MTFFAGWPPPMRLDRVARLARKEWAEQANGTLWFLTQGLLLFLLGWAQTSSLFLNGQADLFEYFDVLPFLFAVFMPAFTMRLFAEEYRLGTFDLLAAQPVSDAELVAGKFVAALGGLGATLLGGHALIVPLLYLGRPDVRALEVAFLGAALLGAFFLALGLWASTMTRSQAVALLAGFLLCFTFLGLGPAGRYLAGPVGGGLAFLGVDGHFDSFRRGVIDARDVLYFLSGTAAGLLGAYAGLAGRRWR